jgi:hypothetical protein
MSDIVVLTQGELYRFGESGRPENLACCPTGYGSCSSGSGEAVEVAENEELPRGTRLLYLRSRRRSLDSYRGS